MQGSFGPKGGPQDDKGRGDGLKGESIFRRMRLSSRGRCGPDCLLNSSKRSTEDEMQNGSVRPAWGSGWFVLIPALTGWDK